MIDEATQAVNMLLRQEHFVRWQYYPGSYSLLVDGNDEKRATESISAMTVVYRHHRKPQVETGST